MSRSSTTTDQIPNPHPGEILLEEFLRPMRLSQTALARSMDALTCASEPYAKVLGEAWGRMPTVVWNENSGSL